MSKLIDYSNYMKRIIDDEVKRYLENIGAICIVGPKWCGKTWTSTYFSKSQFYVADSDGNFRNRRLAETAVLDILEGDTPRLIDEWQEVPSIWDAVRFEVDSRNEKGIFILTGSSVPKRKDIIHSGAGRIGILRMRTMSLYESLDSTGDVSLFDLCNGNFKSKHIELPKLKDIVRLIIRGGFPGNLNSKDITLLPELYINNILEVDLPKISEEDGIRYDIKKMKVLLKSLARNESQTATNKKLASDILEYENGKINVDTISLYLNVFERLYLIEEQRAFSANVRSRTRLKQSSKRHFLDPSLACSLLGLNEESLYNDLDTLGFMFEALVERDLRIYAEAFGGKIFHYQDYENRGVDTIIELKDGSWCAFEIKLGFNKVEEGAKNLNELYNKIKEEGKKLPKVMGIIVGLCDYAYKREDEIYVIPLTALKN